ncbi:MAG: hypothetical protein U9N59_12570 [Campylobacterota bacterium]|nr:hypothetical protein [Campylobacterota bacterium]
MNKLESYIESTIEYETKEDFASKDKIKPGFYDALMDAPIIVYVKNNTIPANIEFNSLEQFLSAVIYVEDIYTLIYLYMNLDLKRKLEEEIACVVVETRISIRKTRPLKNIILLDFFIKRKERSILKSGRIDYEKLEDICTNIFTETKRKELVKKGKYFYQSVLGLGLSDNKINYVYQKNYYGKNIIFNDIKIDKINKENYYIFTCLICQKDHKIILNSIGKKKGNIEKLIIENQESAKYEFACDHDGTAYENIDVKFGIDKKKYPIKKLSVEEKIRIFIYMFSNFKSKNGVIYKFQKNDLDLEFTVKKYLEAYQKND